ncbi:potassium channel family protein [Deinococcus sp.]|uniref:potassium channel family protein n=1 Tax=Deinococcus sp. TaxID=47478 RepID=UPI0025C7277E|nr:potassium channel family protein [Deinococcus sp.]
MLRQLLWIPGTLMVLAVFGDLIVTCLQSGEGRLSRAVHRLLYAALTTTARLTGRRSLLSWSTPLLILGTFAAWTVLCWLGWTLIFWSQPGSLQGSDSGTPANFTATLYFVGYTISTLGMGEITAPLPVWRLLTAVASINGFFLLTFAITFVVPIAQARGDRRRLALHLHRAGPGAQALIVNAHTDHDRGLLSLTTDLHDILNNVDAAHMNSPYLHRFHDHDRQDALDLHLPALGEALLILQGALTGPPPQGLSRALSSIDSLTRTFERAHHARGPQTPPPPDLTHLRGAGLILKPDADFHAYLHTHAALRQRLHAMAQAGNWRWEQVAAQQPPAPEPA